MKIFSACAFVVGTAVLSGTSFVHAAAAAVRSADDAAVTPRPLTLEAALGNDAGMGSGSGSGRKPFEQQATTDKADAQVSIRRKTKNVIPNMTTTMIIPFRIHLIPCTVCYYRFLINGEILYWEGGGLLFFTRLGLPRRPSMVVLLFVLCSLCCYHPPFSSLLIFFRYRSILIPTRPILSIYTYLFYSRAFVPFSLIHSLSRAFYLSRSTFIIHPFIERRWWRCYHHVDGR